MGRRRKSLPQGSFPAVIDALSHDGRGIAHLDGKVTFIPLALPGEQVQFHYTQTSRKYDEGQLDSIDTPAPNRIASHCAHFSICGGCSLQHLSAADQLEHKQQVLLDSLTRLGHVKPERVMPPLHAEPWGYRRKARLGVKHVIKKDRVLVGFRERGGPFIADLQNCPVLHPSIGTQLTKLGELIAALSIKNRLPQIEVAIGDEGAVLIFRVLDPPTAADEAALLAFCQAHGFSAYVQSGGADTVRPLRDAAKLTYALPAEQLQFAFMPSDFTQVNHAINQQMIAQAMDWLNMQPQERALDLFCGLGNFTLPMARRAAHVTGVEGDVALVERARHNAHENGIQNVEFHVANLYGEVLEGHWLQQSYDAVLLDPPRSGALEMMPHIAAIRPKRILYVSCYPGTLARDADLLVNQYGYRLVQAGVMDMFPHTTHLESMALFQRAD